MFFFLEVIPVLLGFIVRQKTGKDLKGNSRYEYALSPDFIKASGEKG